MKTSRCFDTQKEKCECEFMSNIGEDVNAYMIHQMFSARGSVVAVVLSSIYAMSILTEGFQLNKKFFYITLFFVVVAVLRGVLQLTYEKKFKTYEELMESDAQKWKRMYVMTSITWMSVLGIISFMGASGDDYYQKLFTLTFGVGVSASIAGRSASMPKLAIAQVSLVTVPMVVGLLMKGDVGHVAIAVMAVFLWTSVKSNVGGISKSMMTAFEEKKKSEFWAKNLKVTVDNVAYGIVMVDKDMRVRVLNDKFSKIFGLKEELDYMDKSFKDMVLDVSEQRMLSDVEAKSYVRLFEKQLRSGSREKITINAKNGQIVEFTFNPNGEGGNVIVVEDVTERVNAAREIEKMAKIDFLTGLSNRASFVDHLGKGYEDKEDMTIFSLDLDRFKEVNDNMGHPAGDELLKEVARRLKNAVRKDDVVARLGGDEFVILMMGKQSIETSERIAEKIVRKLSEHHLIGTNYVDVGVSIGIAYSKDALDIEEFMQHADLALYKSKVEGRQIYKFYDPEMDEEMKTAREIEIDLKKAINLEEIEIYYQPIVDVETKKVKVFEALARWNHPVRGSISPSIFIPVAESSGLIVDLGGFVLKKACVEAKKWPSDIGVAVNLSSVQFKKNVVLRQVLDAIYASGLEPHRLEVEITESLAMSDMEKTLDVIHGLKKIGVRISLDDFGTGYSSLSYLNQIPFDKVKIDRSFLNGLETSSEAAGLIELMSKFVGKMGRSMVVEGVETRKQLNILRKNGVQEAQGFLFSRPKPAKEIGEILEDLREESFEEREVA